MMAEELKPCPFCASTDIDAEAWASTDNKGPGCMDCGATAETVEIWNTRPSTPPAVSDEALVEELARAIDACDPDRVDHALCLKQARAILPLIHRREQMAAEAMRERCAAEADANRHEECEVAEAIADAIRSLTTEVGEGKGADNG